MADVADLIMRDTGWPNGSLLTHTNRIGPIEVKTEFLHIVPSTLKFHVSD